MLPQVEFLRNISRWVATSGMSLCRVGKCVAESKGLMPKWVVDLHLFVIAGKL